MNVSDCFLKIREALEKIIADMPYEEIEKIKERYKEKEDNQ